MDVEGRSGNFDYFFSGSGSLTRRTHDGWGNEMASDAMLGQGGGDRTGGVIVGGALGLVLYERAGWNAMLGVIACISIRPLFAAFAMREYDPQAPERSLDRPSIMNFLRRPEALRILWVVLIFRASEGLVKAMEGAYLVDAGI